MLSMMAVVAAMASVEAALSQMESLPQQTPGAPSSSGQAAAYGKPSYWEEVYQSSGRQHFEWYLGFEVSCCCAAVAGHCHFLAGHCHSPQELQSHLPEVLPSHQVVLLGNGDSRVGEGIAAAAPSASILGIDVSEA